MDVSLWIVLIVLGVVVAGYLCIIPIFPSRCATLPCSAVKPVVAVLNSTGPNGRPNFGDTVYVVSPDDFTAILPANDPRPPSVMTPFQQLQRNLLPQDVGQFYAGGQGQGIMVYFMPGHYTNLELRLGYFMEAKGLGQNPGAVSFSDSVVYTTGVAIDPFNCDPNCGNADNTFKRGIANFTLRVPDSFGKYSHGLVDSALEWAVSQQCPWRTLRITGDFRLISSGGQFAYTSSMFGGPDSVVTGSLLLQGQTQYCLRNAEVGSTTAQPSQSYTFVGCKVGGKIRGPPTPTIREIPFLCVIDGAWKVTVPKVVHNKVGAVQDYSEKIGNCIVLDAAAFYAVHPSDDVSVAQAQIDGANHLFILPGIHNWSAPLVVDRPDVMVLGIGQPRIRGTNGLFHLTCNAVNCTLASMIIEAGESDSNKTLLISDASSPAKNQWTVLFDVMFCVGGFTKGHVYLDDWVVVIGGSQTIFDGIWCWGADHGAAGSGGDPRVYESVRPSRGVQVNGNDCLFYGLCIEHMDDGPFFEANGSNCSVYGYMSELTYYLKKQYSQPVIRVGKNATNFSLTGWNFYTFSMGPTGPMKTPVTHCCVLDETSSAKLPTENPHNIGIEPCPGNYSCTSWPSSFATP